MYGILITRKTIITVFAKLLAEFLPELLNISISQIRPVYFALQRQKMYP